jgi:3-phenylpropionate/trans-cinnamate dioxygenase ferredoxin reductase subunit
LSKTYLSGEIEAERLALRPPAFWPDQNITLFTGQRVEAVDPARRVATLRDGSKIEYGKLIWAAGGQPRPLTCVGADLAGVHVVRTRQQVDGLRADLADAQNVAIIGGGYIGLETAAVLAKAGKNVTVLEAQPRLLARVAGPTVSAFYDAEHRAHGVDVRVNTAVTALGGDHRHIHSVILGDTSEVPAQIAIVGIGLIPEIAPLMEAGADCGNGVEVDEFCRTSLADVYAIGDCAARISPFAAGARVRLESVQSAVEQAKITAAHILGNAYPGHPVPWFWSNQYDLRLQTVGLNINFDQEIVRGDPAGRKFSVVYLRQGKVVALDCINAVKDFVTGKDMVARGAEIPLDVLADPAADLKSFAR